MLSEPVGELCDFISGLWKGEKPPFIRVNVYRNTNFTKDGTLDDSDVAELDVEAKAYAKRKLCYGDIILEKSGGGPKQPVGRVALFDKPSGEYSLSNFTSAIRVKDPNKLDFNYLHRFLFWQHLSGVTEGMQKRSTGIRNLNGDAYKSIAVPLPPISEQQRTVGILDEAFAGISTAKANTEKNLRSARALFESRREEALNRQGSGWEQRSLSELCTIKHGFAFKSQFFTKGGKYVLLTPGNFYEAGGYRDRGGKQKYYDGEIPDGFILKKGDLLVAMTEQAAGLLGSPILVPQSNRFLHNQRLGLVLAKPHVPWTNDFFFHVFNLKQVRDELHSTGTGLKVRHTSPKKIGDVVVSLPTSVSEQQKIAAQLFDLDSQSTRLESQFRRKLAALDALKKSLLHHAFTGKLRGK